MSTSVYSAFPPKLLLKLLRLDKPPQQHAIAGKQLFYDQQLFKVTNIHSSLCGCRCVSEAVLCVAVCVSEGIMALWDDYSTGSKQRQKLLESRYGRNTLQLTVSDCLSENWKICNSKTCPHCFSRIQVFIYSPITTYWHM